MVLPPSSWRQADAHRASAFNRFESGATKKERGQWPLRFPTPVSGLDKIMVLPPSSRRQADAHRASAFNRFEPGSTKKERGHWPLSFLVPVTGLEPVRHRWRRILRASNHSASSGM